MTLDSALKNIRAYSPPTEQEASDKRIMLSYAETYPDTVLTRANEIAHFTSSAFIVNPDATMMLMAHHNIRGCWAWTGGHADGDADLLAVALREAMEETGAAHIRPITEEIAATDILVVFGHTRRGKYVSAHLHLNTTYLFVADEKDPLTVRPGENTAVAWLPVQELKTDRFSADDQALYGKLLQRARERLSLWGGIAKR